MMKYTLASCLICCAVALLSASESKSEAESETLVSPVKEQADTAKDEQKSKALLNSIVVAQSKLTSAKGIIDYRVTYTKDKERSPTQFKIKLQIRVPNKYNILTKQDDLKEWFISDGRYEWHVEDVGGDKYPSKKDLKSGKGKFSSMFTDFIPLRREKLEKHFHVSAKAVGPDCVIKGAATVIELRPITADQKDHLKYSKIYLDKKHQAIIIQTLDANDNLYAFKIQKMEYNVKIPDKTFVYAADE